MPATKSIPVQDLSIDLANFRTVKQESELGAIKAMIAISPDYFWALTESLATDGYLPTDTVIVLKGSSPDELVVKEGNRRVAAMKILHGLVDTSDLGLPASVLNLVESISPEWVLENTAIPCAIFEPSDAALVDRIVTRAHGKGEKAGRDQWNPVARARHNRDVSKKSEPGLDLLEKYLLNGKNITGQQKERWSGQYPLSVLDEAIKKVAPRLGAANAPELAKLYPTLPMRSALEEILRDIGMKTLGFDTLRRPGTDFAATYGIPPSPKTSGGGASPGAGASSGVTSTGGKGAGGGAATSSTGAGAGTGSGAGSGAVGAGGTASAGTSAGSSSGSKAHAANDSKYVTATLKAFTPHGPNRQKVVVLKEEALKLKLKDNPLAFCFLLRSMFEISAKAYCADHPSAPTLALTKPNGKDKTLAELLGDIALHIAGGNFSTPMGKTLHGARTELGRKNGLLSVTSMNMLVHSPTFLVGASDICVLFGNVYPLLEAMN